MKLNDLTTRAGEWLRGNGPMSEIVISSRIRLARNLTGHRFLSRASRSERNQLVKQISCFGGQGPLFQPAAQQAPYRLFAGV